MLEAKAKDQGHKCKCSPKKKKGVHKNFFGDLQKKKKRFSQKFFRRRSSQKIFKRSPQKNVFQKIFQVLHKILTIQKILLSSSRGQANFRGLEASRPRTSKCVLEDSTSDTGPLRQITYMQLDCSYVNTGRSLHFNQIFVQHWESGVEYKFFDSDSDCRLRQNPFFDSDSDSDSP